jgi:hypothetical protein
MKNLKRIIFCIGTFIFCLGFFLDVYASPSIKEILKSPDKFDKKEIEIKGELIGEPLRDKDGFWINVSLDNFNIGIFITNKELLKKLKYWGSYKVKGDIVKIKGTFFKECPDHHERDIHAQEIIITKPGFLKKEVIPPFKFKLAMVSFIICLTITIIYFIKIK